MQIDATATHRLRSPEDIARYGRFPAGYKRGSGKRPRCFRGIVGKSEVEFAFLPGPLNLRVARHPPVIGGSAVGFRTDQLSVAQMV